MDLVIAIETGGTKLQFYVGDFQGSIIYKKCYEVDMEAGKQGILDAIECNVNTISAEAKKRGDTIRRIGIGFGGVVDYNKGITLGSMQIGGWGNFRLKEYVEEKTNIATYIYCDTDAAAWGEFKKGIGKGSECFFYTNIGSGIGGGGILGGKLYRGQGHGAFEFGQTYIDTKGTTVESACSGWAIQKYLQSAEIPKNSILMELVKGKQNMLTCKHWAEGIVHKDRFSMGVLDKVTSDFAVGLANVVNLISPEVIAIGGGVSSIGEPLISRIRDKTEEKVYKYCFRKSYKLDIASLGEEIVPIGVLLLTLEN